MAEEEQKPRPPLTQGMFGSEFKPKTAYGLHCGQMNGGARGHNAGWYNARGEKIGWGDLSQANIDRLMNELPDGELFIILSEHDSFWEFVVETGAFGWMSKTSPTHDAPGIEYVLKRAYCLVGHNLQIRVGFRWKQEKLEVSTETNGKGQTLIEVSSHEALAKMGTATDDGVFVLKGRTA